MKLKKGDLVKVISGKIKGTVSKITIVDTEKSRVFLENGPIAKKHLKPERNKNIPAGGIIDKPSSIHMSNVMLMSESNDRPVRVGYVFEDGKKVRVAKGPKCGGQKI